MIVWVIDICVSVPRGLLLRLWPGDSCLSVSGGYVMSCGGVTVGDMVAVFMIIEVESVSGGPAGGRDMSGSHFIST